MNRTSSYNTRIKSGDVNLQRLLRCGGLPGGKDNFAVDRVHMAAGTDPVLEFREASVDDAAAELRGRGLEPTSGPSPPGTWQGGDLPGSKRRCVVLEDF